MTKKGQKVLGDMIVLNFSANLLQYRTELSIGIL